MFSVSKLSFLMKMAVKHQKLETNSELQTFLNLYFKLQATAYYSISIIIDYHQN